MEEQFYDQLVELRIEESKYEYEKKLRRLEQQVEQLKKQIK